MRTIIRQTSIGVIEQALQVEQRSDVRVRLPVVVAEQAFVVTGQAREYVGSDELIIVRKALRRRNLDGAVKTLSSAETARRTGGAFTRCSLSCARLVASRIEDEVGVAVIKRSILDHISHVTIDSSTSDGQILGDLIFKTHRSFANALRL